MDLTANCLKGSPVAKLCGRGRALVQPVFRVLGKEAQKGPPLFDDLPPASGADSGTVCRLSQVCASVLPWGAVVSAFLPPPLSTCRGFRWWAAVSLESVASGKAETRESPALRSCGKCQAVFSGSFECFAAEIKRNSLRQGLVSSQPEDLQVGWRHYLPRYLTQCEQQCGQPLEGQSSQCVSVTCTDVAVGWVLTLTPPPRFVGSPSVLLCFRARGTFAF